MFIADQGINQTFSRLIMTNMDGSDVTTLAAEESRRMVGVAYDFITDLVYWSEFNEDEARIELISIREFERKVIFTKLFQFQDDIMFKPLLKSLKQIFPMCRRCCHL